MPLAVIWDTETIYLQGHQYETVSGFVCASFGYIPEEGAKMLVILEKDYRDENDEYQEEGSDRQDDREKTQAYELEVITTIAQTVLYIDLWYLSHQ